jgi:hypothetical protein
MNDIFVLFLRFYPMSNYSEIVNYYRRSGFGGMQYTNVCNPCSYLVCYIVTLVSSLALNLSSFNYGVIRE